MTDALAVARLVRLVRRDSITDPLREAVIREAYTWRGVTAPAHPSMTWQDTAVMDGHPPKLAELLSCSWCVSVWCAAFVVLARRCAPRLWEPVARMLAMSFVGAVLDVEASAA